MSTAELTVDFGPIYGDNPDAAGKQIALADAAAYALGQPEQRVPA